MSRCSSFSDAKDFFSVTTKIDAPSPHISPSTEPQPLLPVLGPSPLRPFTNNFVPKLSGMVYFSFSVSLCETLYMNSLLLDFHLHILTSYNPLTHYGC